MQQECVMILKQMMFQSMWIIISLFYDNYTIAPIISLIRSKMKKLLGVYGVDEMMISQFCKAFGIVSELVHKFLLYWTQYYRIKKNQQCNDTGDQLGKYCIVE